MTVSSSEAKTHQTSEQPKAKGEAAAKEIEEKVNKGKAEEVTVGEPQNGEVSDADIDTIEAELAAGSRAFAFKNYAIATECFSKACEKLTTHHPENYSAIIDAHLSYGKALLRNAINLGSLSGGLNAHNPTATEPEDATPEVNGDAPSSSKGPAEASTANEEIDQAEEPVTVEDELENAFQVLDFARQSILTQIDSSKDQPEHVKKLQTKLIDVYDLIAQVHQEGEQFEQAVESYKSSLEVKKSRTDAPAGTIAETHLMIALALELIPDEGESMKQAIGHIDEAIDLMKSQLDKLTHQQSVSQTGQEGQEKPAESVEGDKEKPEAAEKLKSEIEETQSLIGELEAKREELKTVPQAPAMTEADKALQAYLAAVNSNPSTTNGKAAINDLTSLVKKRARPVESSSDPQANNASASSSGLPPTTNSNLAAETPSKKLKTSNQTTDV
ncbi:hypothetical protein H4Q26_012281 [Puccinia striiformis f. sp. tritici PST-130]|nr:hypothetical protein H4Q26_012281 [Puccinia striiformis f. sp. tritici PST-130]